MTKKDLADVGEMVSREICKANDIPTPCFNIIHDADDPLCRKIKAVGTCGYYRNMIVNVAVPLCAHNNSNYSWPGFISDRTPAGVIAHEVGHHVDQMKSGIDIYRNRPGQFFSDRIRAISGEKPITSYSPNNSEWFAEIFRLFTMNPDLLKRIRPKAYQALIAHGIKPIVTLDAESLLKTFNAPERVYERMNKWISTKK